MRHPFFGRGFEECASTFTTFTRQDIGAAASDQALPLIGVEAGEEEGIGAVRDVGGRVVFHPEETGIGGFSIPAPVMTASLLQFGPGGLGRLNCTLSTFGGFPSWAAVDERRRACPRHW